MQARSWLTLAAALVTVMALAHVPRHASAGACAGPRRALIGVIPTPNDAIPIGEGILVQVVGVSERNLGEAGPTELGVADADTFGIGVHLARRGERPISLRTEVIAPGLARYVPTRPPTAGTWQIVSRGGQSVDLTFGESPAPPVGPAPMLASVVRHQSQGHGPASGSSSTWITATTRSPLVGRWAGVLTYGDPRSGTEPLLSRALDASETQMFLYTTPGRCAFHPPGQSPPGVGHEVSIATYDVLGRISARSNTVQVSEGY